MGVIFTFKEKRRQKQMIFEKRALRELSLESLRASISRFLKEQPIKNRSIESIMEDYFLESAIESYLLGARYSKFSYYGEQVDAIRNRSLEEEKHLVNHLYHYFYFAGGLEDAANKQEVIYEKCKGFVETWWREGFHKGERRYKLRLIR
ncbi:DUF2521 family protein [Priestia taiwanensis]|uniref:DUF2521 family protein n=1 Tax=Priestia taiwanensis TaxID=1347902 RepID=A0A917ESF5_9BACI|nr:DUF2521 family protein [Priestia taiwanensis]MBM7365083.1 hypothetical protein [Priestia taiwanensis]GGE84375.1 hypothetical protein GCM10007140_37400 [Priestia taiwanensis]